MSDYIRVIWFFVLIFIEVPVATSNLEGDASERPAIPNVGTEQEVPKLGICRDGWSRGTMNEEFGKEIPICVKINPKPQTWNEAQTTCRQNYGFMLKLHSNVLVNNDDIYSLLHKEAIGQYWTGVHSEHGYLVWDDFLPNVIRPSNSKNATSVYERPWSWENNLVQDQQNYCGMMHLENDGDKRRRKRSPDDDSNDNLFPGLNLANFRHRLNNFGRRTNRFPSTSAFQSFLARTQMSDQLSELPGAMDLLNNNGQESDSQSSSVTTDGPTFGPMTTFDTDSDNAALQFGLVAGNLGSESNDNPNPTPVDLLTSVRNVAATLTPGMERQGDSPVETLRNLMNGNLDAFNNDNNPNFDSNDGSQSSDSGNSFGNKVHDLSVSDDTNIQSESVMTATASPFITSTPVISGITLGSNLNDTNDDESNNNIEDSFNSDDISTPTEAVKLLNTSGIGEVLSNTIDELSSDDNQFGNTENVDKVDTTDILSTFAESVPSNVDSITSNDSPLDVIDASSDDIGNGNDSPSDVVDNIVDILTEGSSVNGGDTLNTLLDTATPSKDEISDDTGSPSDDSLLSKFSDAVDLPNPSDDIFGMETEDVSQSSNNNVNDINDISLPNPIEDINDDHTEGLKDVLDDVNSDNSITDVDDLAENTANVYQDPLDILKDRLEDIQPNDISTIETDRNTGNDKNLDRILDNDSRFDDNINPFDTLDNEETERIDTPMENFETPTESLADKTEDLQTNYPFGDIKDAVADFTDVGERTPDNMDLNTDDRIEDLHDQLSDAKDFIQPPVSDATDVFENDNRDVFEMNEDRNENTVTDTMSDIIDELPDTRETLSSDTDVSSIDDFDHTGLQNQDNERENERELEVDDHIADSIDNVKDYVQDIASPLDSLTEKDDHKDDLYKPESTSESELYDDIETKRDLEWGDVGDWDTDHNETHHTNFNTDESVYPNEDDDDENNFKNRQAVVDGSFDWMNVRGNEQNDDTDHQDDNENDNQENDRDKATGEVSEVEFEDRDESGIYKDLPTMEEDFEDETERQEIMPVPNGEMTLESCDVKLPSVCFSYEVLVSNSASTCDDGWYGHVLLDTCYKVLERKLSYPAAVSKCKSLDSRLVIANTEFERKYSLIIVQQQGRFHRGQSFWMESPSDKSNCRLFNERGIQTIPSCRAAMNVICVKDSKPLSAFKMNQVPGSEVEGRYYDENGDEVIFLSTSTNNKIPCPLTSAASEFPVLWYKDGILVKSMDTLVSLDTSLSFDEDLLSAYSTVTDRILTTATLQGQYWCEVWDRQTLTRMKSHAFNVRFSDVISFHGSMEVGEFSHEDEVLFNMMNQKFPKLTSAELDIQKVFYDVLPSIRKYVPNVESVSAFIDGVRSNPYVLEYHTYFTMSNNYTTDDEQLVYSKLKAGLRSKLGNRNYIMDLPGHTPLNSFKTMSLQSTVSCPAASLRTTKDIYGHVIAVKEFLFPTAMLGEFANSIQTCSSTNQLPAGSARCLGDFYTGAYWSEVVANECIEETNYDSVTQETWAPSAYTAELTHLAETTANSSNAEKLVSEVAQIAKVAPKFTPTDIDKIADVLEHTTQVKKLPKKVGDNVLRTIDRLMTDSYNEAHVANVETKAANRIIKSLERFAENADLGTQQQVRFVSDNVVVEIWDLKPADKPVIGLAVETNAEGVSVPFKTETIATVYNKSHLYNANVDAAIELPVEVFTKKEKGASISERLTMIVYRKSKLFQAAITDGGRRISPTDQQMLHLNSYVISASIAGKKIEHLDEKVKCIFKPKEEVDGQGKCVWWDFTMNDNKGGWSNAGCVYDGMINGRDVCLCDHLTNFAVLIDFYGQGEPIPDHHELSLSIITVLGLSCSILGLSLTIISFLFFRKLRQGRAQQTLFNLSLSLLLSMLIFLVGIKQTHNDTVCIVVAILLHYLILVSFMWMLMEAILQYLTFVKILGTYITRFMLKTVVPAWGLPLLPVISVLSIDYNLYNGGPNYCWMDLSAFYYAFAVPITCIIVINITIFIVTIISIFRRGKGLRSNQKKQKMAMTNLQAAITSFILLGLTWVFGYLAISDARLLFQYVFTILNSLQGFFIFILFVVRKKKVRDQWYIICCRGNEKDRVSRSLSASNSIPSTYRSVLSSRFSRSDLKFCLFALHN
ncbi:G-protein coupled receptor [Mactra antiquata]